MQTLESGRAAPPPSRCFIPDLLRARDNAADTGRRKYIPIQVTVFDSKVALNCKLLNPDLTCRVLKKVQPERPDCRFRSMLESEEPRKPKLYTYMTNDVQLRYNADTREVAVNDHTPARLSKIEGLLLEAFLNQPGVTLTREELNRRCRGDKPYVPSDYNVVTVHLLKLRQKIGRDIDLIQTVLGSGYHIPLPLDMNT